MLLRISPSPPCCEEEDDQTGKKRRRAKENVGIARAHWGVVIGGNLGFLGLRTGDSHHGRPIPAFLQTGFGKYLIIFPPPQILSFYRFEMSSGFGKKCPLGIKLK